MIPTVRNTSAVAPTSLFSVGTVAPCRSCAVGTPSTVPSVESDDIVDPGDAALQALLADMAENTHDDEKREKLLDAILTIPPLTEWPPDSRKKLWETCQFINSLAEDLRQRSEEW